MFSVWERYLRAKLAAPCGEDFSGLGLEVNCDNREQCGSPLLSKAHLQRLPRALQSAFLWLLQQATLQYRPPQVGHEYMPWHRQTPQSWRDGRAGGPTSQLKKSF
uniref:Uncharacterized protein n=1 Tax=Noctiluca scintillans TaxID=2966 RepID=A0A7S1FD54_NOCSC|mmetsp:Transcript_5121/g.14307  ORF Transcript_5121/g.14307 Transcript_5121/m.14307 type:complete len:105 (+) Transcript_5121:208-522(+)